MFKYSTILFFLLYCLPGRALPSVKVGPLFKSTDFTGKIDYLTDSTYRLGSEAAFLSHMWKEVPGNYPNFGETPYPHWVRFTVESESEFVQTLTFLTKSIDSLQVFLFKGDSLIKAFPVMGSHFSQHEREFPGPFLTATFEVNPQAGYSVLVRMINFNYRLTASPFKLLEISEAKRYLRNRYLFNSIYIGGMSLILLFALVLTILFGDLLYVCYLGCIALSLSIMLMYNDYSFVVFDKLPFVIVNKNIYGILTAMVPVVYLLFVERYLRVSTSWKSTWIKVTRSAMVVQLLLIAIFIAMEKPLFQTRNVFYPFMVVLSGASFYYIFRSVRRSFFPARLLLIATVPVYFAVLFETLSDFHGVPVQQIHDYYYYATLFEMFVLTFGLAYRFRQDFDQKRNLQKEILRTEVTTQERERVSIAADLHDIIGAQLSAIRLNLDYLQIKYFEQSEKEWWNPVYGVLGVLQENVSSIAERMSNSSLDKLGLADILRLIYGHLEKPVFRFDFIGMEERLPVETERVLYVVIVEAFNNSIRHSQASEIYLQLIKSKHEIKAFIEDNGIGFDLNRVEAGQGLKNMEQRICDDLGGEFSIDSSPDSGTIIIIRAGI